MEKDFPKLADIIYRQLISPMTHDEVSCLVEDGVQLERMVPLNIIKDVICTGGANAQTGNIKLYAQQGDRTLSNTPNVLNKISNREVLPIVL